MSQDDVKEKMREWGKGSKDMPARLPNGGAWAAVLGAGIGCAALGFLITLGEDSKFFASALNFYNPAGNLSGKTTVAVAIWLSAWAVLYAIWKNRTITRPVPIAVATVVLVCLGVIMGSPFFFSLFSSL